MSFQCCIFRIQTLKSQLDEIQEQQHHQSVSGPAVTQVEPISHAPLSPSNVVVKMPAQLDLRLNSLEKQVRALIDIQPLAA